jgi:hypothetical protein
MAPTVKVMLYIALGLVIGVLITTGPIAVLSRPVGAVDDALINYGSTVVERILVEIASLPESAALISVLQPVAGVTLPGFIGLLLAFTIRASVKIRRFLSAISIVGAAASFLVLPFTQAAIVLACALLLGVLTGVLTGIAIQIPLTVILTSLAVSTCTALLRDGDQRLDTAVLEFSAAVGTGGPELWRVVLLATALIPFAGALWVLIKD